MIALIGFVLAAGCTDSDPCDGREPAIHPGSGFTLCEGEVRLGASVEALEPVLGLPTARRELAALGARIVYPEAHLVALERDGALVAIELYDCPTLKTAEGIGLGSPDSEVKAALGAPEIEPFLGTWRYPSAGIALTVEQGVVVGLQLFVPTGGGG